MIWVPQFLRTERKTLDHRLHAYLISVIGGVFFGYATGGWLADRFGRRCVFIGSATCAAALAYVYTHTPIYSDATMLALGLPLGFFASAYYSAVLLSLKELFPTSIRGSGVGFTYNAGRAIGGLFPFFVGTVSATIPLTDAISVFAAISFGSMLVTARLVHETNGMALRS